MDNRFYPDFFPTFPNEPTTDKFRLISSEETGEGIIALVPFQPGETVFSFSGVILPEQTLHTLQLRSGQYIHDPVVMGKVLHSCDPNTHCDMETRTFTAIKPIAPGDYVTMDYDSTEDELFRPFICRCGADDCRGLIRGRAYQNDQVVVPMVAQA